MAAPVNTYLVRFHYANPQGQKASEDYSDYVQATAGDEATILAVLNANNRQRGPAAIRKITITSIVNVENSTNVIA